MSGLIERIVRRRRASASNRLGPASQNGNPFTYGAPLANGGHPEHATTHVNGFEPATEEPTEDVAAVAPEPAAPASPLPAARASSPLPDVSATPPEPDVPGTQEPSPQPRFRERGRVRRRARYLRQLREIQLRDLGGFVVELHRLGRERPDLVQEKIAGAARTDAELRALERAMHEDQPLTELRAVGIGGACAKCGAVYGSEDRFCASCGQPLK